MLHLIMSYHRIPDSKVRVEVLALLKTLGRPADSGGRGIGGGKDGAGKTGQERAGCGTAEGRLLQPSACTPSRRHLRIWRSNVLLRSSRRGCTMNGAVETYVEWLAGAASTGEIARRFQELLQQHGFARYSVDRQSQRINTRHECDARIAH